MPIELSAMDALKARLGGAGVRSLPSAPPSKVETIGSAIERQADALLALAEIQASLNADVVRCMEMMASREEHGKVGEEWEAVVTARDDRGLKAAKFVRVK